MPESSASRSPSHFPVESPSKKKHRMPANTIRMEIGGEPLEEEAQDAGEYDQDGDQCGLVRLLAKKEKHQDHDPDRRGVLKDDRVAGSRQLVGDRIKGRDAGHREGADKDSRVEFELVARDKDVEANHERCDDVARAVDGERIPRDQLHEQAAGRKAEGGGEHARGAETAGVGLNCLGKIILVFHNTATIPCDVPADDCGRPRVYAPFRS